MAYVDEIMESVLKRNPGEPEFHQAVREILDSIAPVIAKHERDYREEKLLERIVEPERSISFRVAWTDDPRVPHTVQQCSWPVQGRDPLPSFRQPLHHQLPRF